MVALRMESELVKNQQMRGIWVRMVKDHISQQFIMAKSYPVSSQKALTFTSFSSQLSFNSSLHTRVGLFTRHALMFGSPAGPGGKYRNLSQ
jgi:hypothetical protein